MAVPDSTSIAVISSTAAEPDDPSYTLGTWEWLTWGLIGNTTSISYKEGTKTSDTEIIQLPGVGSSNVEWSGSAVTSRSRTLTVEGYFTNKDDYGTGVGGSVSTGEIPEADATSIGALFKVGTKYKLGIVFGDPPATFVVFKSGGVPVSWVVTSRDISFSGSNPVSFSVTFEQDAGALC